MTGIKLREWGVYAGVCAGLFAVLYLFYRSFLAAVLLPPAMILYRKIRRQDLLMQRRTLLRTQFKDMLESLAASLRAGYSVENALQECASEMEVMHGAQAPISEELRFMCNQIRLGIPAEKVFQELASRSFVEDIDTFASVFSIAKRTGGDMVAIIRKTVEDISGKIDTGNEIAVLVSSKKLEMRIMTLIPAGIIVYVSLTSGGLLDPLYGNAAGILIMTVCLIIYAGAALLGRKIMRIEV